MLSDLQAPFNLDVNVPIMLGIWAMGLYIGHASYSISQSKLLVRIVIIMLLIPSLSSTLIVLNLRANPYLLVTLQRT